MVVQFLGIKIVFFMLYTFSFFPVVASCKLVYFWKYYSRALSSSTIVFSTGSSGPVIITYILTELYNDLLKMH